MSSLEDKNFLYHYQSTKFQESDVDPFITCNVMRKCLAQTHQASTALCGNDTTCLLLQKNLQAYANIVDNKENGGVNNYAQSILEMVSHIGTGTKNANSTQWKSGLKSIDPKTFIQLIEPPKCDMADDNGFCQSAKVTEGDINLLLANRNHKLSDDSEGIKKMSTASSNAATFTPQPNQASVKANVKENGRSNYFNWGNSVNVLSGQHTHVPQREATDSLQLATFSRTDPSPMDIDRGILESRPPDPRIHSSSVCSSVQSTNQVTFKNVTSTYKPGSNDSSSVTFTTASEELAIQNAKKWGSRRGAQGSGTHYGNQGNRYPRDTTGYSNQGYNTSSNYGGRNYGGVGEEPAYGNQGYRGGAKKTLGCRRGAMNKFVPPVRRDNEEENTGGKLTWCEERQNEEVDERLKNIDPKMVELIRSEIMDSGAPVQWDDIAGLEFAKATIQEIVVWPLLRPDIFTGLRRPPKGILLFGPPGTGKTLIGKCIASQSCSTFFSISASSLTSKWIGDGEKMVRALFAVASCHQPAVVFIDEIDSLLTQRSDSEHESSRRIKTEFLVQLDGATTGEDDRTLVIGATNRPQELDEAARRRLVKRLYIPLPEFMARRQLVERLMSSERHSLTDANMEEISQLTEGYSGADMKNLCQEACLGPIRSLGMMQIKHIQPDQVRAVDLFDFKAALTRVRASVSPDDLDNYIKWDKTFGSGGAGLS